MSNPTPRSIAMPRLQPLIVAAALSALAGCVAYPYPDAVPTTVMTPPNYDRSWDAALGAAADAGVQLTSVDRASGRAAGTRGSTPVTIEVVRLADGNVRTGFSTADAALNQSLVAAYNRRMGR
jgi:hypothetical protein